MAEELNQMALRLRYMEENAEALQQNIQLLQATIDNFEASLMTLTNIKEAKTDQEVLIKIGSAVYVKAKMQDPSKVIVGVGMGFGSDIFVEKTIEGAKETLNERVEEVRNAQNMIQQNLEKLIQQINMIRPEFERRYAQFQQEMAQSQGMHSHDH
ncbi:MAG: prefoldin subunit alpha [Candidatus Lokiarchaeota archaeon]|nr:prefoldin subunit alpha [Candidatus Lokiarchaeota archaeon]